MITALTGENSFAVREALATLIKKFQGTPERIDGSTLELSQLPNLLMGGTLFAQDRLIIIKDLSQNSTLWPVFSDWLDRVADTTHLILVDGKPDKRTVTYKTLKSAGVIQEFPLWTDRDHGVAEKWVIARAGELDMRLSPVLASHLVYRVGLDQWQLASALEKLSLLDTVTKESIDEHIDLTPSENVFQLFELALEGKRQRLHEVIVTLELTEDSYAVFALLSSQVFQLAAVALAGPDDNPAKDFAIHPFVVSKLSRHAKRLGSRGARHALQVFAKADADMKRSKGEPWLLVEKALLELSQ